MLFTSGGKLGKSSLVCPHSLIAYHHHLRQEKLALESGPFPPSSGPYLSTPNHGHHPTASESTIVVDDAFRNYKGGDKLSVTSTRDSEPRFPPLEAPQPRRPVSIHQRAYVSEASREATPTDPFREPQYAASPYGAGSRGRQESVEEVGWDMGAGRSGAGQRQYHYRLSPFSANSSHLDDENSLR
jgi:hypothetical protein